MYPLDRYLGTKPGLTQPEEWQPKAPPSSPSNDSDFFERAQSVVREAETQLDSFRKIYNIESESEKQQPEVTQSVGSPVQCSGQVSHPSRMHNIVVALDALQAESSRLEDDVLRARAFAKDISNELDSDRKPSKSGRTCQRRRCERRSKKLVSERSHDPQESVKDTARIPSPRKQIEHPQSEAISADTYDIKQKKLSPPSRSRNRGLTWHTNLLRAKSSTEGTDDGYNTSDGRRCGESQSTAEGRCKCAINKKKCLCLSYHKKVPEKPAVERGCACKSRKCSCSSKEVKSSQKWQLSRHQSNYNICPCCEQQKSDHVKTVMKKKYTPGCCKATLIDVKTKHWSTEEEEEVTRKKLPLAKLTIQELPSINIRRELKIQRVPSYELPKPPGEEIPYTPRNNVGLIDYTHDDRIREQQSRWRKGDDIRQVRRSSYIGENVSDSEVHHAHRMEKEVIVVHPANGSSKPGPSKPCTRKASACQCSLRSHKSVHFSGVEEHTFMFDLNHGRSFSLERRSSETEYSGIEASTVCDMIGLQDSNFACQPFDDTDYDSETGDACVHCQLLSCSSHHRAADTKPVSKFSSQEQPQEKQDPKNTRPVPKPKKQIPIPQERKQDLGPVWRCRKSDNLPYKKSDNFPCKSRKTLEEVRTADMSSTLQHREEGIQTDELLVRDRQEETLLKSAAVSCKSQQSSSMLQKRDQAGAEPHSPPPKNRKHLLQSSITQTSYSPQEGPSTSCQWEQISGVEIQSLPCKSRKNLVQEKPSGTSTIPEESPSTLHHMERTLGGDQAGKEARLPPCKHRRNLVQTITTQTSYTPQEGPSEQSSGVETQSPSHKHKKNQEPFTTAVPKTKIARHERKTFPFPDSSYIPIAAMAPFPPPAKDRRTKHSELRKTGSRSEKTQKMDQNSVFPDVSYIPMVIQSPKGIQSFYDTDYHNGAADDRVNSRLVPSSSLRREVRLKRSSSDTPTITVYSSKDQPSKRQETRVAPAVKEAREMKAKPPVDGCSCGRPGGRCCCGSQQEGISVKVETRDVPGDKEAREMKAKPPIDGCSCGRPGGRCCCGSQQEGSSVKVDEGESKCSEHVNIDLKAKPSLVPKSKRCHIQGIFEPLAETPCEDLWKISRNRTDAVVQVESNNSAGFIPQDDPIGESSSFIVSAGSIMHSLFRSHKTEQKSSLCVSGIPFLIPDSQHQTNMALSHTSHPLSEVGEARQLTSREADVDSPPDTAESPEGQTGSGDVTSSAAIRELQQAIMSRVEHAIMRGLLNESETSDSTSEVTSSQQDNASLEVEEAAAPPAEYEEDFESEEEGAEEEPVSEEVVGSEDTAQSAAEDSQELSLPTSQEAAVQTSFIKRSKPPQTFPDAAVQTSFIKHSEPPQMFPEAAVQTSFIKRSPPPQTFPEAAVQTSFIKRSQPPQTFPEAAVQTSFIKRSQPPENFPESAVQTSFTKRSQPPQTFPEAAVQTSFTQPSSSLACSPEVAAPTSPSKSSSSTAKISPQPSDPTRPCSSCKKLSGVSGHTSQRSCSFCAVAKPSSSLTLSPAFKKNSIDSTLVSSPKKSTVEMPTELSPPRTPTLSPKKASPSRSPVKTPPRSPESGSFSPAASPKKTPPLSAESSSSDTDEQVLCITTPLVTPPHSPSPSLPDVETPSLTERQQQNTESSQTDEPVQPAPEPRQRHVEEILVPIGSERTDVSCTILSDSVATDRTSETPGSLDQEETVLSEGEIRVDPCPCKNCRRSCVCPGVSMGELHQPCRCGRSVGELQPQTDDSIGEVHRHKHTSHCRHSHRSSTYSDGQVLPGRAPRRHEEPYSAGEVAHDDVYSAGQVQSRRMERHIEVYLSSSLTGQSSDSEVCSSASLCGEVFDQEIYLPSVSNGNDEPSQTILSIGQLNEDDSGS
ncbi:titin [Anabrus simplex]|uniref:titin n=1 Tax=Anabrus simplex TaxID=316456 RepID=UPI0035A2B15B